MQTGQVNNTTDGKINAWNTAPAVIAGATLLSPIEIPYVNKISPLHNWSLQYDVLKHFKEKSVLNKDVFDAHAKRLGNDTMKYLKDNKKLHWSPILKKTGICAAIIAGIYAISAIAVNYLENKKKAV